MFVAFVVVLFQVKWTISLKTMTPKFSKLNPVNGFKKFLSKEKIVELLVEVVKIAVVSYLAYQTLRDEWKTLFILYDIKLEQAILLLGNMAIDLGLKISMIFLVIGFGDLIYQKIKFRKDMRMSKQEVKDEFKNTEGDPQVKGKIRAKMREVSQRRMMQALPTADVVITNPTHLAAAIKYDKTTSEAPVLIAKGADFLAQKIKEVARENHIEIVENKPLARMLYYNVELGEEIPPELYQMTAEVLAYVYGLKNKKIS
jgi:flagellar biosynthetic protein FlhB